MKPCPRIVTFESRDAGALSPSWCARFWASSSDKRAKPGFLPLIFDGRSQDAVIEAAGDWWRAETAKQEALVARRTAMKARSTRGPKHEVAA